MRFELGSYERGLMNDKIMVDGLKAMAVPLGAGFLGLGIAMGGFLAYNKIEDLTEWLEEGWETGFGAKADPEQIQEQVSGYIPKPGSTHIPEWGEGMAVSEMYRVLYDMRNDLAMYFSQIFIEQEGIPVDDNGAPSGFGTEKSYTFNGPNHEFFMNNYWGTGKLGTPIQDTPTFRFERPEVILFEGKDVNEISEYTYQMIIRETDSRNTQARIISGAQGAVSTGIGLIASEATHWMLRRSGFMANDDGWDGQNWEEANGANFDPLLMFAWARTDFQTGKWWSTADSVGSITFWANVADGYNGSAEVEGAPSNLGTETQNGRTVFSYETIIREAHREMTGNPRSGLQPFLRMLSASMGGIPYQLAPLTPEEEEAIAEAGRQEQEAQTPGGDDQMPGEEPDPRNDPTKEEYWRSRGEQPPPGWTPS